MRASYGLFLAINISFGFGFSNGDISNGDISNGDISNGTNQSVSTGLIGNEVLPSCIYSSWLFEPVTAFCGDKSMPDIIDSRENKIDPKFTGCVFTFPDQYKNANFSILIKDLRVDDAGLYQCHIHKLGYQSKITDIREIEMRPVKNATLQCSLPSHHGCHHANLPWRGGTGRSRDEAWKHFSVVKEHRHQ